MKPPSLGIILTNPYIFETGNRGHNQLFFVKVSWDDDTPNILGVSHKT